MIELTKLNGSSLVVNSDLIEFVEVLPDSLITLTTGKKIMVKEGIIDIVTAVVEFRRRIRSDNDEGYRKAANQPDVSDEPKYPKDEAGT
jgi:flagellar protein FlbD